MRSVYALVRQYCVWKLAGILFEHVDCSVANRFQVDHDTAEHFVNNSVGFVNDAVRAFVGKSAAGAMIQSEADLTQALVCFDLSYQHFEQVCGRMVWEDLWRYTVKPNIAGWGCDLYTRLRSP